jgi:Uma2 family endonuclease
MTARKLERRATYEDVLRAPEGLVAELIDGELYTSPRPRIRHARVAGRLIGRLERAFDTGDEGPGGWMILMEPELWLHDDTLVPDIGGWHVDRAPTDPEMWRIDIPPDWICEVLSPSTRRYDRVKKMAIYARHGIGHAWLADPIDRTLEVKRLENGRWTEVATYDEGLIRAEPFDAIEIDLAKIWGPPPESPLPAP